MLGSVTKRLAGWSPSREMSYAAAARSGAHRSRYSVRTADEDAFVRVMDGRVDGAHAVLGTVGMNVGEQAYRLPLQTDDGAHLWLTAGSGAGKTRLACGVIETVVGPIIADPGPCGRAVCIIDLKGDLADGVMRLIAARLAVLPRAQREALRQRIIVLRPFAGRYAAPFQMLAPHPGVPPLVQARAVAEVIETTLAAPLGSSQGPAFVALLALAIERGLNLVEFRFLLQNRSCWTSFAESSAIPEARLYVLTRFAREKQSVFDGLSARVDGFLGPEAVKACAAASEMIDMCASFAPGAITIADFSGAPLGADGPRRALASIFLRRLVWAAFDPRRSLDAHVLMVCDEIQEGLTPSTERDLVRVLTTGRSFRISLFAVHQGPTQLSSDLLQALSTNVTTRIIGRSSESDARASLEWMPRTGRVSRPRPPGAPPPDGVDFLGRSEEAQHWVDVVQRLVPRRFLVSSRVESFQPRFVHARSFNPPPWRSLDPEVTDAVLRGGVGRPREELLSRAREIEERVAAELISTARSAAVKSGRRDAPLLPDVISGLSRRRDADGGAL